MNNNCKNCGTKQKQFGYDFCGRTCGSLYKMCKNCGIKQKHIGYEFCGRTCGVRYTSMCKNCGTKQKTNPYEFCGKFCANQFNGKSNLVSQTTINNKENLAFNDFKICRQNGKYFNVTKYLNSMTWSGKGNYGKHNGPAVCFYNKTTYPEFYIFCNFYDYLVSISVLNVSYSFQNVECGFQCVKLMRYNINNYSSADIAYNNYIYSLFNNGKLSGEQSYQYSKTYAGLRIAKRGAETDEIMYKLLLSKFNSNGEPCRFLKSTEKYIICEVTSNDVYWGIGTRRNGTNMLGQMLMQIRG
jgi:hypothetical protein